jgi:serine/threonine-protein kinase
VTTPTVTLDVLTSGAVLGTWRLQREVGHGAFGTVWEAEDARGGSTVAVKTMLIDLADQEGQVTFTRFQREVDAVGRLRHPNIVAIYDAGRVRQSDGKVLAYFAMEFLEGKTLARLVAGGGALPVPHAVRVVRQAAAALHVAHQQGIVHRDVKPENIMLAAPGRAVVMDFGVCKLSDMGNVTTDGAMVGTVRYVAPEQFVGMETGPAADQFSLAAVLFYLLTGTHLRAEPDVSSVFRAVTNRGDLKRLEGAASVPAAIRGVLRRALDPDAKRRFGSMLVLADALAQATSAVPGADETMKRVFASPAPPAPVPGTGTKKADPVRVTPPAAPEGAPDWDWDALPTSPEGAAASPAPWESQTAPVTPPPVVEPAPWDVVESTRPAPEVNDATAEISLAVPPPAVTPATPAPPLPPRTGKRTVPVPRGAGGKALPPRPRAK